MFSVVIPLYNKELSIKNTIYSVLNQTFQDFEIVIVNDGSTDDSISKVHEINDTRIRIIDKDNGGVSSARNIGIKNAKYEWIALLDGDDLWEDNHLSEIVRMMNLFSGYYVYATSFKYSDNRIINVKERETDCFLIENYLEASKKESLVWSSIAVINIECFRKVGYFNEKVSLGEDLDMWQRIGFRYTLVKSSIVTAIYRIDAENRSNVKKLNITRSILFHYDIPLFSRNKLDEFQKKDIRRYLLIFLRRGDFGSFYKLFLKYSVKIFFI